MSVTCAARYRRTLCGQKAGKDLMEIKPLGNCGGGTELLGKCHLKKTHGHEMLQQIFKPERQREGEKLAISVLA